MNPKSTPNINVFDIANWFLAKANSEGRDLNLLKLQRLVYFAYGWYCASNDDPPLFAESFYAWRRGIVVKVLHERYEHCGSNPIIDRSLDCPVFDENVMEILQSVWKNYSPLSDHALSQAIRGHSTWRRASRSLEWDAVIPPDTIREYFKELAEKYEYAVQN